MLHVTKIFFYASIFFILCCFKTDNTLQLKSQFTYQNISYSDADYLNNIYTVFDNIIQKRDITGKIIRTYNNKNMGDVFSLDASNPLKIVVFYKEFRTLLFLDNTLTLNGGPYLLNDHNISQPLQVCSSFNNSIWVYDQQNFELVRLDANLQITHRTGNISQVTQTTITPYSMLEYNNKVFVNDTTQGIFVFDIFGSYLKTYPLKSIRQFQVTDEHLLYTKNDSLFAYDFKSFDKTFLLNDTGMFCAKKTKDYLIDFTKNKASIYQLK